MERAYELQTHRAEDRHWWYRGRRRVLHRLLAGLDLPQDASILDGGCGSGRNLIELARYGEVSGVEISEASAEVARGREVGEVHTCSLVDLPFAEDSFDLVTCLDVIEHLDDDVAALTELRRVVKPGGRLVVMVPAYNWLWSRHDSLNHHRRRYSAKTLRRAARAAGWRDRQLSHMNSLLLPVAIMLRAAERVTRRATESSLDLWIPPQPLNWLLQQPMNAEATLIAHRVSVPVGLSLVGVFD